MPGGGAVAESFFQAGDFSVELTAAEIFHGNFFFAVGFATVIGAGPGDEIQGFGNRAGRLRLDRHGRTAHHPQTLRLNLDRGLSRRQVIQRMGQHADRAANPRWVEKHHGRYWKQEKSQHSHARFQPLGVEQIIDLKPGDLFSSGAQQRENHRGGKPRRAPGFSNLGV